MPSTRKTLPEGLATRLCCRACGRMGHRSDSPHCSGAPSPVAAVGIEVEGFWFDLERVKGTARDITGSWGTSDGSLSLTDDCRDALDGEHLEEWEFRTRPGTLGEAIRQLIALYPDWTNETAGMHVHCSFASSADVGLLHDAAFFHYYRARWQAWGERLQVKGEFWTRLEGRNDYCTPWSDAIDNPYQYAPNGRYHTLNWESYSRHRTLECRLLPMFRDLRIGIGAVEELVSIYTDYLTSGTPVAELVAAPSLDAMPTVCATDLDLQPRSPVAYSQHLSLEVPPVPPVPPGHRRFMTREAVMTFIRHMYNQVSRPGEPVVDPTAYPVPRGV